MIDFHVEITDSLLPELAGLERALVDPILLYAAWEPIALRSVDRNFQRGGSDRGAWEPLASLTVAAKGHARPLEKSGALRRSITAERTPEGLAIGPPPAGRLVYAGIQHFGGTAGPRPGNVAAVPLADGSIAFFTGRVQIPARPYNLLDERGIFELEDATARFILDAWYETA